VEAFQALNFETFAAGDSYNDLSMIETADHKALYCPPERLIKERPDLKVARTHKELRACIEASLQIP
jgi:phosphoserine/homoserine phosphotransferase